MRRWPCWCPCSWPVPERCTPSRARTPISYLVIAVFYGFMIVFPPLIAVVALIGVADQTLELRRRFGLVPAGLEV